MPDDDGSRKAHFAHSPVECGACARMDRDGVKASGMDAGERPGVRVVVHRADELPSGQVTSHPIVSRSRAEGVNAELDADDERWVREAVRLLSATPDMSLARTPALISVSQT